MKHLRKSFFAITLVIVLLVTSCGVAKPVNNHTELEETMPPETIGLEEFNTAKDVAYVLIYNPDTYSEDNINNKKLYTGDFETQIRIDVSKADDIKKEYSMNTLPLNLLTPELPELDGNQDRADEFYIPYKEGDMNDFFCSNTTDSERQAVTFECIGVGENINVWIPQGTDYLTHEEARILIDEFENKIYEKDTQTFGEARFAENGHKINILAHNMESTLMGYFTGLDLLSKNDYLGVGFAEKYKLNLEHAIIHINYLMFLDDSLRESLYATVAHEFQHLICFSSSIENGLVASPPVWLNESMSGYIEELLYPGIQEKDGRYDVLESSDLLRHGQSLYNFKTDASYYSFDIGVYGRVFLFSEYLESIAGRDVFHKIHDYYRQRGIKFSAASSIRKSVPLSVDDTIDESISYPAGFLNLSADDVWLSKLTLNYYLSKLNYEKGDPEQFELLKTQSLLFDELDGTEIEGGGRVIVETKQGTYQVPQDAERGLVYIGLDKDFNVITKPYFY